MADKIEIQYDAGKSASEIKKIEEALKNQIKAIEKVTRVTVEYNSAGGVIGATFEAIAKGAQHLSGTLQKLDDVLQTQNLRVRQNTEELNKNAEAQTRAANASKKRADALKGLELANKTFSNTGVANATVDEGLRFRQAQQNLLNALGKKGAGLETLKSALNQLNQGLTPSILTSGAATGLKPEAQLRVIAALRDLKAAYEDLGGTARRIAAQEEAERNKVIAAFQRSSEAARKASEAARKAGEAEEAERTRKINQIQQELNKRRELAAAAERASRLSQGSVDERLRLKVIADYQKQLETQRRFDEARKAEATLRSSFAAPTSTAGLRAYEANIQRILSLIERGKISLADFNRLMSGGGGGGRTPFPGAPAPGDENRALQAINNLRKGFNDLRTDSEHAGRSIFLRWQSILRIFEVQTLHTFFGKLINQFQQSAKTAQDFSIRIAEIETIQGKAALSTSQWSEEVTKLADSFGKTQLDVAEGVYETLSNQIAKGTNAIEFMNKALNFSLATVSSAKDSINLLSSAINSFGLSVNDTDKISSVFFKTIELGRVRASEMSNSFGQMGFFAKSAGVSLEEISAAITTLTINGIKFHEAQTLINNVLLKLVKPSKEMSDLFQEWGFTSGQAAIAALGFHGVLQKIGEEVERDSARTAQLFNEMRALKGIFGLTGDNFTTYKANLEGLTNATEGYKSAVDKVANSLGHRLKVEIQKIESFFTTLGTRGIEEVLKLTEHLGGLANVIITVTKMVIKAVEALIVFNGTNKAVSLTIFILDGGLKTLALSVINFARGTTTATIAAAGFRAELTALQASNIFGAVAAASFLITSHWLETERAAKEAARAALEFKKAAEARSRDEQSNLLTGEIDRRKQALNEYSSRILKLIAQERQRVSESFNNLRELQKEAFTVLKIASESFLDVLQQSINNIKSRITEINNELRKSAKLRDDLVRQHGEDNADLVAQFMPDWQKTQFEAERLKRLREEARRFAREALANPEQIDTDKFANATKYFEELQQRLRRHAIEVAKILQERGQLHFTFDTKTGEVLQGNRELLQNQRVINDVLRERLAIQQQYEEALQREKKFREEQLIQEKQRLEKVKELLKTIMELENLGDPEKKSQFKTPEEGLKAIKKARDELLKLTQDAISSGGFAGNAQQVLDFFNAITVAAQRAQDTIRAGKDLKALDARAEGVRGRRDDVSSGLDKARDQSIESTKDIDAAINRMRENVRKAQDILAENKPTAIVGDPIFKHKFFRAEDQINEVTKALDELRKVQSEGNIDAVIKGFEELDNRLKSLFNRKFFRPSDAEIDKIRDIANDIEALKGAMQRLSSSKAAIRTLEDAIIDLAFRTQGLEPKADGARAAIQTLGEQAADSIRLLNEELLNTLRLLDEVQNRNAAAAAGKAKEEPAIQQKAMGGPIYGPGTGTSDSIPARLSNGEYVINARSTAKHRALIERINQDTLSFARGGFVNVKGFKVHSDIPRNEYALQALSGVENKKYYPFSSEELDFDARRHFTSYEKSGIVYDYMTLIRSLTEKQNVFGTWVGRVAQNPEGSRQQSPTSDMREELPMPAEQEFASGGFVTKRSKFGGVDLSSVMKGSSNNSTLGDLKIENLNVYPQKIDQQGVREIAATMRRELNRKTISLES